MPKQYNLNLILNSSDIFLAMLEEAGAVTPDEQIRLLCSMIVGLTGRGNINQDSVIKALKMEFKENG